MTESTSAEDLIKRVEALEMGQTFDATAAKVKEVQMEYLEQLRAIRKAMVESGGGSATSSKELDALKSENAALKKQNAKQAYRIQHLVSTVEQFLEKEES
mmetsp:Transcript_27585/g.38992  ORF Transcript_27585/g.38992 Transcript_27585/m.38992 type:complete len:100 (-) Transcript_27585:120-419(-)